MINKLEDIVTAVKGLPKKRVVVAVAQDEDVLKSVYEANKLGLVDVSLIGDKVKIFNITDQLKIDVSGFDIIKELDDSKAIRIAVDMINSGHADTLMKGMLQTAQLFKVVLEKETGLRTGRTLSHAGALEIENYHKLLFISDGGINIAPDLNQKADIIQNSVDVALCLGIERPKVAVLSAIEVVNPSMPSTLDAAILSKMADRGQIKNCIVDGPLALDNAISAIAAAHKGIKSEVAGDADILIVPNIESGNVLYKSLVFLCNAKSCGLVLGAKVPLIVTSRADNYTTKLYSIALASLFCANKK